MVVLGFFILQVLYKNFQNDETAARKSASFYKIVDRKSTVSDDILGSFKILKKPAKISRSSSYKGTSRDDETDEFKIIKKK